VDRALAIAADADRGRAERFKKELERTASSDPRHAATIAYELGELSERKFGDDDLARSSFTRALALDASLRSAHWGLRRMLYRAEQWPALLELIEQELLHASERERADLLLELAYTYERVGRAADARAAIDRALAAAPEHEAALVALQRMLARGNDRAALLDVTALLGEITPAVERRIAYRLAVARDPARPAAAALRDCEEAAALVDELPASDRRLVERLARTRAELAEAAALSDADLPVALGALAAAVTLDGSTSGTGSTSPGRSQRDMIALQRRRAQLVRKSSPQQAWDLLKGALEIAPDDPVLLADLIEVAGEVGRYQDLIALVRTWRSVETDIGRTRMVSAWCAAALGGEDKRFQLRPVLAAASAGTPGFLLVTAATEGSVFADPDNIADELATTYVGAARAAVEGTWAGPGTSAACDTGAAVALYVQAADLLAHRLDKPGAITRAREALARATELAPDHPAVIEAGIELDDLHGTADQVRARVQALAGEQANGDGLARAIRIAASHDLNDIVIDLERRALAAAAPDDPAYWALAYRLEATLRKQNRGAERSALLAQLGRGDGDPRRRSAALFDAARGAQAAGDTEAAAELYLELAARDPGDRAVREAYLDLLRQTEKWTELVAVRRAEIDRETDAAALRRAYREAAWVLEVRLGDSAEAAELYDRWHAQFLDDRTALEGVARCRGALRDPQRESIARAAIAQIDQTPDARWLHARSVERAGRYAEASELYREILGTEDASVAVANAAVALGDLAAASTDVDARIAAARALARHTSHPELGASLHEQCGWLALVMLANHDRAREELTAALERDQERRGALLGLSLAAGDEQAAALAQLAATTSSAPFAAALRLRAAALTLLTADPAATRAHIDAAYRASPDDPHVICAAAESALPEPEDVTDPFGAAERFVARADLYAKRAALAEDGPTRRWWTLQRAELLELAEESDAAAALLAGHLDAHPHDRRALATVMRIAARAGDNVREAEAAYVLAQVTRAPELKAKLLRIAAAVYDRPGPTNHVGYAVTIYRQLVELEPSAPEAERLLALLREASNSAPMIDALSDQIAWLVKHDPRDSRALTHLLERAVLLRDRGRIDLARSDLDAVLAYSPRHPEALRLRAALPSPSPSDDDSVTIEAEMPDPRAAPVPSIGAPTPHRPRTTGAHTIVRSSRAPTRTEEVNAAPDVTATATTDAEAPDPFGGTTPVADLSKLQEQEQHLARVSQQFTAVATRAETPSGVRERDLQVPEIERMEAAIVLEPSLDARRIQRVQREELSDTSAAVLMPVDELLQATSAAWNAMLAQTERELEVTWDADVRVELLLDAGYLAGVAGEAARALQHYEAALALAGSTRPALAGMRTLALRRGDLREAARLIESELPSATPAERIGLAQYRLDLLLALGERDLARQAVSELLVLRGDDLPLWLASAELAVRDRRMVDLATAFEHLATIDDAMLRSAAATGRAAVAVQAAVSTAAASWFTVAADADVPASAARIEAIRYLAAAGNGDDAGAALLEVALHVDRDDPITAAGFALRAQSWITSRDSERGRETIAEAAQLAARGAPKDALVARSVAESALAGEEANIASHAFVRWTRCKSSRVERAYAAARAAELEPARFGRLWSQVLELDPGDDYATARLRAAHVAGGALDQAIELDLAIARESGNDAPVVRAARALVDDGEVERAIELLAERPASPVVREALADAYAMDAQWEDSARVLDALANEPGSLAVEPLAWWRAHAWTTAWRNAAPEDAVTLARTALDAWAAVLEHDRRAPVAHANAMRLAASLNDAAILGKVLARARANESSPWAGASLALRHARAVFATDPKLAVNLARAASSQIDDPRCTMTALLAAASRNELATAASVLEERATRLETDAGSKVNFEPVMLRTRAAWLALEGNDVSRARALLTTVDAKVPDLVSDLIAVATLRSGGVAPKPAASTLTRTCFARLVHDADLAVAAGSPALALEMYTRALAMRPGDPIAAGPLVRLARQLGNHAALAALARDLLRAADTAGDVIGQADARELLGMVAIIRGEHAAARTELATALRLDPSRWDLLATLEIETAASTAERELLDVRDLLLARRDASSAGLALDTAVLAMRRNARSPDLAARWHAVLAAAPSDRNALFHLESYLRGSGASEELARTEERIADTFDDTRAKAAFLTRAGETYGDLGLHTAAVDSFARAHEAEPAYTPTLDAWRSAALAGEEWIEVARATLLDALREQDAERRASLEHFAAVALMDKAHQRELAIDSLIRALEAQPAHTDSLLRLRMAVQTAAEHEQYTTVLSRRADVETDIATKVELLRLLAEEQRELGNTDEAVRWYRAMLAIEPADVRAHAAIAECSTDPRDKKRLADAIQARIPLERDVEVLRALHYRLGELHLDDDPGAALAAFKQALAYRADDGESLRRVIELAVRQRDWQTAALMSDRLIDVEMQPERRGDALLRAASVHLHGFGDRERAAQLVGDALQASPTETAALDLLHQLGLDHERPAIASGMRERLAADITDGAAARMLSRTAPNRRVARIAAELADLLGFAGDAERALLAEPPVAEPARLVGEAATPLLFEDSSEPALRHIFRVFAGPIARVLGTDVGKHGVGRKDKLASSQPAVAGVRAVATALEIKEPDVYVSASHPYAIIAEPTRPISLVLGNAITADETTGCVRFAAGAALVLARLSLAIPARLPPNELAVVATALVALVRSSSTDTLAPAVVSAMHQLRKHATAAMLDEARPAAASLSTINAVALARDLKLAGLRAGILASGSLHTALTLLAGAVRAAPRTLLDDMSIRQLVLFALS
jgi:tetratricopeptide (TPR) repeat protein